MNTLETIIVGIILFCALAYLVYNIATWYTLGPKESRRYYNEVYKPKKTVDVKDTVLKKKKA